MLNPFVANLLTSSEPRSRIWSITQRAYEGLRNSSLRVELNGSEQLRFLQGSDVVRKSQTYLVGILQMRKSLPEVLSDEVCLHKAEL
jgi:hypothetical protein